MVQVKNEVVENLKTIPNAKSLDEIFYTLYLKIKLARSEDDIKNGRVRNLEDFDKEMEALYESHNIWWGKK